MTRFDIAPFALPHSPPGELRFEEARDVEMVEVTFADEAPYGARLQTMRKVWPETRMELSGRVDLVRPMNFGWVRMDDLFTPAWVDAATEVTRLDERTLRFTFKPLRTETPDFPGVENYDVTFRRTVGVRVAGSDAPVERVRVFTCSEPARSLLRVTLNAEAASPDMVGPHIEVSGYNAVVLGVTGVPASRTEAGDWRLDTGDAASFALDISHMRPAHRYAHDDAHLLFSVGEEAFTISLTSLEAQGPIWFPEAGIYITLGSDPETLPVGPPTVAVGPPTAEQYRARIAGSRTIAQQVVERPEQSLAGAMNGQPRPHPIAYCFGCKHARQKFWMEPNGDVLLTAWMLQRPVGRDTPRWKNGDHARILFGLDRWAVEARHNDPWPVMAYNLQFRRDAVRVRQKAFAVPLTQSILAGEPAPDETIVALVRFTFENTAVGPATASDEPAVAELRVGYTASTTRSYNRREALIRDIDQSDTLIPVGERESLEVDGDQVVGSFEGERVLRMVVQTEMDALNEADGVRFRKELAPGERCELLLRIPYVALESDAELAALRDLNFERCYDEMARYWGQESRKGAQIRTPDPNLNAVYAGHLPIILMSDLGHPDGSGIVNTSVGSATYGNYTNESVMIIEELEQRGLVDEVRRRLAVWTRYQGTVGLIGRFTDHEDVFFGADGLESGHSYNQHHGWALWYLARHYLHTGDRDWFAGVVDNVVRGAEWIARQRRETAGDLPHSRGWERGWLPAGALEDVDDFFYWLSTNCLTWRGLDVAATALEHYAHPDAARYRQEADAFRHDLIRGFETARRHSPLIRLRDGRWIPHYPSRLYCRGRDLGWIREVLEGSVYLLISGLYDPESREGGWILDDYHDTRYLDPPFGYPIVDPVAEWFDCGGFSAQPNLLAGLLPHLDRDEIEVYLWMFFNAWAACYREEVQAMIEHPQPVLGFNNTAPFKTSDQSNAMKWLAYMFVYERNGLLHLGRALPRAWFGEEMPFGATRLSTPAGLVSITYRPQPGSNRIEADVDLTLRTAPEQVLLRFRHPRKEPIRSVSVNGEPYDAFDAERGDVVLPPGGGVFSVVVDY
jgi:hypothetical protein